MHRTDFATWSRYAAGEGDLPAGDSDPGGSGPDSLAVVAAYPNAGSDWNDYVARDPRLGAYEQVDAACDGSQDHWRECVHGGELRRVDVAGVSSCAGLQVEEALDAFLWECVPTATGIRFRTVRLNDGRGLRNLVDGSGWLDNSVAVMRGAQLVASSPPARWWNNAVQPLPAASSAQVSIGGPGGTIYTVDGQLDTFGYIVEEPRVAVAVLPGGQLQMVDNSDNCNRSDGTATAPDARCLISVPSARFLWFEGHFGGIARYGTSYLLNLIDARFATVRGAAIENFYLSGVRVRGNANRILDSTAHENSTTGNGYGFDVVGDGNLLMHLRASRIGGNSHAGLLVDGDANTVHDIVSANNNDQCCQSDGIVVGGYDNVLSRLLLSSAKNHGLDTRAGARQNTFAFITSINNGNEGVGLSNGCNGNTFNNLLVANNTLDGIRIRTSSNSNMTFANIASLDNQGIGVRVQGSDHRFVGHLLVGNNGPTGSEDCVVDGGTTAGLVDGSCADSKSDGASTYAGQLSDASLWVERTSATSIVGPITVDDTVNTQDIDGRGTYGSFDDWHAFESRFRAWGRATTNYPGDTSSGTCNEAQPDCQIWDYRLRSSDTILRNRVGSPDAIGIPESFDPAGTCPSAAHGDVTLSDRNTVPNTFLLNAYEIMLDDVGDEDGLCESNETCIYAPSFGAYQGEGALIGPCAFVDGVATDGSAVRGVTLMAFSNDGVD